MPRLADRRVKIDLLRAAEATFAEHGLAAAKVEDITARAGVSKGAFYLHFDSKEDCFRQIVEALFARLASSIEPPPGSVDPSPETLDELRARWHAHDREVIEACWQNRALLGMILAGGGGAPFAYLIDELAGRAARRVEGWLRRGKEAGLYRSDIDPAVTASLIAGAYDRFAREVIRQPKRPDIEAWCRQALDLFMKGLLLAEGGEERARRAPAGSAVDDSLVRRAGRGRAAAAFGGKPGLSGRTRHR